MIKELIEDFDEAAMSWGWTSDQGSGGSVLRSKNDYDKSRERLMSYAIDIEATLSMIEMHESKA